MNSELFSNPIIQYGFAGLSVVLLGFLAWLVKRLLSVLEKTTKVIAENTSVIGSQGQEVQKELSEVKELTIDIHNMMLQRQCVARDK